MQDEVKVCIEYGIDLGGTNMKAGIVDENHKIVIQDSIPTRVECTI